MTPDALSITYIIGNGLLISLSLSGLIQPIIVVNHHNIDHQIGKLALVNLILLILATMAPAYTFNVTILGCVVSLWLMTLYSAGSWWIRKNPTTSGPVFQFIGELNLLATIFISFNLIVIVAMIIQIVTEN